MPDPITAIAGAFVEPTKEMSIPPAKAAGSHFSLMVRDRTREKRKRYVREEIDEHFELRAYEAQRQHDFDVYIKKLDEYYNAIPEEERIVARDSLVGPAVDAAEHYIGEEELRDMFAQRIASCYDQRKIGRNHPAFVNTLQDLSPLDAHTLKRIYRNRTIHVNFPFTDKFDRDKIKKGIKFYYNRSDPEYQELMKESCSNDFAAFALNLQPLLASSVNSLERAGLIAVIYKTESKISESLGVEIRFYALTDLGADFCSVCLPPKKEEKSVE